MADGNPKENSQRTSGGKPSKHVHFEDEIRGRSRQRTSYEKASRHTRFDDEIRGRSWYRYRSSSRSRSRSRSRGQRRPPFRQHTRAKGSQHSLKSSPSCVARVFDESCDTRNTGAPRRDENFHNYGRKRYDDQHYKGAPSNQYHRERETVYAKGRDRYQEEPEMVRRRTYYCYPKHERNPSPRPPYHAHQHEPRVRNDVYDRDASSGRTTEKYASKRKFYISNPNHSSSHRSSSYSPPPTRLPPSRRTPMYDPHYDSYYYHYDGPKPHRSTVDRRREPSLPRHRSYVREIHPAIASKRSVEGPWLFDYSDNYGTGGVKIRIRYRRWE